MLCPKCAGETDLRCSRCDGQGRFYEKGLCSRCVASDRLFQALENGGSISPHFAKLYDALVDTPNPKVLIAWLHRSKGAELLRSLARKPVLRHEDLDVLPQNSWLRFVRNMLMGFGALPERSPEFSGLELWLEIMLASYPKSIASIVRMFGEWHVLRRLRRKATRGAVTISAGKWARARLRAAADFLKWLQDGDKDLGSCRQGDVEDWVASGSTVRYLIRDFISWTNARTFTSDLRVPERKVLKASSPSDEDEQWSIIDRFFLDSSIPLRDRVAGLFVTLFAQPASRISRLTSSHIGVTAEGTTVLFGRDPLLLPPLLGKLLNDLVRSQRRKPMARRNDGSVWIFNAKGPSRPIDPDFLRKCLQRYGMVLRPVQRGRRMQLAAEVAPAILAGMFGLHINTAVKLHRDARGSRVRYAVAQRHYVD
jgi:hypothetical protein